MKRKCLEIRSFENNQLYVDEESHEEILAFASQHEKKFRHIVELILRNISTTDIFGKEEISKETKHVWAIKFKSKYIGNARIYCFVLECAPNHRHIVMCELYEQKKTTKLTQVIKNIIEKISTYEYDLNCGP